MADNFNTILKAIALAEHTIRVTSNCNRYPKKFRFSLVDKMQNTALEIYELLDDANEMDIRKYKAKRLELQTMAIHKCSRLNTYIDLSAKLNIISLKSAEYWSKMVNDVKHMTLAWRKKDQER